MISDDGGVSTIAILLVAEGEERSKAVRQLVHLAMPKAFIRSLDSSAAMESEIPPGDVALIDGGSTARPTLDTLRFLRARGFGGGVVVIVPNPEDSGLRTTAQSLGAACITRSDAEKSPAELGAMLARSMADGAAATAEVAQARRVFAAGQAALSLQHSINNPLAALLAEAQLLELEELSQEHREAVERMIELCRRIIALVRRLDVLGSS